MNVLLGICGGIAACKAPELVRELGRAGARVRCLQTAAARKFCTPLSLEVLSGGAVYDESYLEPGTGGVEQHVELAQWADVYCVAPATANTLSRLSLGLADDLLTTTALMFEGPLVVAPAMHSSMWQHPAIEQTLRTLAERGVAVVGPDVGPLASGEFGVGRLAPLDEIAEAVVRAATQQDLAGLKVVVSAGPTWEAIDSVRFLANRSSGKMGYAIAAMAGRRGAETVVVSGPSAQPTPAGVRRVDVRSALEMQAALEAEVADADIVIMAAAVADYRPSECHEQKLKKSKGGIDRIELTENPDILLGLRTVAPDAVRVGFAAETEDLLANAQRKLEGKDVHLLVANDVSRKDIGFDSEDNEVTVLRRDGEPISLAKGSKPEVAQGLLDIILGVVQQRAAARR